MNDPFGQAIADYYEQGKAPDILIHTNYTENETLSPACFFREEKDMPELERIALNHCRGKVLDVGAAAGCHSLVLQAKGLEVTAIERSEKAVEVMRKRGVVQPVCTDLFHFSPKGFDTILLLMNGTGLGQTTDGLRKMLIHLKGLLNNAGQILIDSSDIRYLFEEEDGSVWMDLANNRYYGEMVYDVSYKDCHVRFPWLFTGYDTLFEIAGSAGLACSLMATGDHHDFLARLFSV